MSKTTQTIGNSNHERKITRNRPPGKNPNRLYNGQEVYRTQPFSSQLCFVLILRVSQKLPLCLLITAKSSQFCVFADEVHFPLIQTNAIHICAMISYCVTTVSRQMWAVSSERPLRQKPTTEHQAGCAKNQRNLPMNSHVRFWCRKHL